MKVLLVCGGREYGKLAGEREELVGVLDSLMDLDGTLVIHGGARGADSLADWWAEGYGWDQERYPADWEKFGRSAGHRRNGLMAARCAELRDTGLDVLVVAFPGGKGTANMVARARYYNLPVHEVPL